MDALKIKITVKLEKEEYYHKKFLGAKPRTCWYLIARIPSCIEYNRIKEGSRCIQRWTKKPTNKQVKDAALAFQNGIHAGIELQMLRTMQSETVPDIEMENVPN